MKLFVDTANVQEIEQALRRGFVRGITTNPSILSKEDRRGFKAVIQDIIDVLLRYGVSLPLSVEPFTTDPTELRRQAEGFLRDFGGYDNLVIKVPVGWDELEVIYQLRRQGARVNCTCCMSFNQAVMAAQAGADFVSLFWGRIRDTGYDAATVVRQTKNAFAAAGCPSEIIVGSIRQMVDVNEAILAGTDIVTVPPKFLPLMCSHPKTDEAVQQFVHDFAEWNAQEVPDGPGDAQPLRVAVPR